MIQKDAILLISCGNAYYDHQIDSCAIVLKDFDYEEIEQGFLASSYKTNSEFVDWMITNGFVKKLDFVEINYDELGQ